MRFSLADMLWMVGLLALVAAGIGSLITRDLSSATRPFVRVRMDGMFALQELFGFITAAAVTLWLTLFLVRHPGLAQPSFCTFLLLFVWAAWPYIRVGRE